MMGEITVGTPLRGLSPSGSTAHGAVSTASDLAETPGKLQVDINNHWSPSVCE
jgi:hypothetical protein